MANFTDAQYKLAKDQEKQKEVRWDNKKIDDALTSDDEENMRSVHIYIDGKYGAYVPEWDKGLYGYVLKFGFNYELIEKSSLLHNLQLMKAKLEGYAIGFERPKSRNYAPQNSVNVNVSNTNEVNVSVSFETVKEQIENMTSLTDKETEEILEKIKELEQIINSKDKKKNKWEKAKSVLIWLADKSCDIGMALLPLLLKIQE